jgi:hypothetical protein
MVRNVVIIMSGRCQRRAGKPRKGWSSLEATRNAQASAPFRHAFPSRSRRTANRSPAGHCCTERCWSSAAGGQNLQRAVAPDFLERPALTLDADDIAVRSRACPSSRYRRSAACWHWVGRRRHLEEGRRRTSAGQILDRLRDKAEIVRSDKGFAHAFDVAVEQHSGHVPGRISRPPVCPTPGRAAPAARPPA